MIYTPLTKAAMRLCFAAHRDQVDRAGLPYVFHPFHVAEQMEDELTAVTALLHDVLEDTACTLEALRDMGYPPEVLEALSLLTHDKDVPYLEYVMKLRQNAIARAVKMADLRHNMDLSRLDHVSERDVLRLEKYKEALRLLEESE